MAAEVSPAAADANIDHDNNRFGNAYQGAVKTNTRLPGKKAKKNENQSMDVEEPFDEASKVLAKGGLGLI